MAERRMLTRKVTDDDNFMALSSSAQALYLHLSMSADDDGFNNQVSLCMFKAHASVQDLEALLTKRYVYQFDNGVIVIKHWRMANALRKDRYTQTAFREEMAKLRLEENGAYTMATNGCQVVANRLPQNSIDKDRVDKNIYIESPSATPTPTKRWTKPTLDEVKAYCAERGDKVDAEKFYDFYESKDWYVGKNKMKDFKAAIRNWERSESKPKGDIVDQLTKMYAPEEYNENVEKNLSVSKKRGLRGGAE